MRALVVVNHQATTTTPRTLDVMLSALRHDLKIDVAETDHRGHAVELTRAARVDCLDLVIALGGDGTVNEVVNGLLEPSDGPPVPQLAIVPGGSTNVLARNLGIPGDPVEATGFLLDAVRAGRHRAVGLGYLAESGANAPAGLNRWFTFCAGVGFDADVVRAVEQRRAHGRRSTASLYARTAVRRLLVPTNRGRGTLTLERPDVEPISDIALAVVTNTAPWTYLGRRPVNPTPQASFDDGLDLFALTRLGVASTLRHVAEVTLAPRRGPRGNDVVVVHDQQELSLRSDHPVPVQVDGDYLGECEFVTLRSAAGALQVVC